MHCRRKLQSRLTLLPLYATMAMLGVFCVSNSNAQTLAPRDHFLDVDQVTREKLIEVDVVKPLLNDFPEVKIDTADFSYSTIKDKSTSNIFYIIRLQGKNCDKMCPTLLFWREISNFGFRGALLAGRYTTISDVEEGLCSSCETGSTLIFYAEQARSPSRNANARSVLFGSGILTILR